MKSQINEQFQQIGLEESQKILEDAKAEYCLKKEHGYSREKAFQDFEDVQHEITTQLASHRR
jgi:hypothetical protein